MAFIVPNAPYTGTGAKYANINQSEPDSLDLEVLGNHDNYVRSGGVVTVSAPNSVAVTAGVAVVAGVPYSFNSFNTTLSDLTVGDYKFHLVVARLSGGTVSCTLVSGATSTTNPMLPKSKSVLSSSETYDSTINFDPDTDVVLASILKQGTTALSDTSVVDKRIINTDTLTWPAATVPASGFGLIGDVSIVNGVQWVKTDASTWTAMSTVAQTEAAKIPIGGVFAWAGSGANPNSAMYLECDGQAYAQGGAYTALFNAIGTSYGAGSGAGQFQVPNLTGDAGVVGATQASISASGRSAGDQDNLISLSIANMPAHNHGHSLTMPTTSCTIVDNPHKHLIYGAELNPGGGFGFVRRLGNYDTNAWVVPPYSQQGQNGLAVDYSQTTDRNKDFDTGGYENVIASVTVPLTSITGNINSQGSGTAFSVLSKSVRMRWFIRYA